MPYYHCFYAGEAFMEAISWTVYRLGIRFVHRADRVWSSAAEVQPSALVAGAANHGDTIASQAGLCRH